MRIQHKFMLLFLALGAIVVINIGVVAWAITTFQRELARPLESIQQALVQLYAIKQSAESQQETLARALPPTIGALPPATSVTAATGAPTPALEPVSPEAVADQMRRQAERMVDACIALEKSESYLMRAGISTSRNLRARVETANQVVREWNADPSPARALEVAGALVTIRELVEKIEGRIIAVAAEETTFQQGMQQVVITVLAASLAAVFLAMVLASMLIRRWIVRPVRQLRIAAGRFAQGDFAYRTAVVGRDELAELGTEVNHMAGTISAMQEERVARERLAAMGEMVRRIVHNLRNPLAGIRGLAEVTRDDLEPSGMLRENQDRIIRTVDAFEQWLRALLHTTRPLELVPKSTEIATWLEGTLVPLQALATNRQVRLVMDGQHVSPRTATFDPDQLGHAVVGIMTNAIQASPTGGEVRLETKPCLDGMAWELWISDQGPGIPTTLTDKIFQPHFTTKADGTGIGLAVAKQVVEQHSGRIWFENIAKTATDRGGTTFKLRIPLHQRAESASIGQVR